MRRRPCLSPSCVAPLGRAERTHTRGVPQHAHQLHRRHCHRSQAALRLSAHRTLAPQTAVRQLRREQRWDALAQGDGAHSPPVGSNGLCDSPGPVACSQVIGLRTLDPSGRHWTTEQVGTACLFCKSLTAGALCPAERRSAQPCAVDGIKTSSSKLQGAAKRAVSLSSARIVSVQLGLAIAVFDKDDSGFIDYHEFCQEFHVRTPLAFPPPGFTYVRHIYRCVCVGGVCGGVWGWVCKCSTWEIGR